MEITFHLPAEFTLPIFYEREEPDKIALALRLGAEAVEQLYKKTAAAIREETHEQTTKELEAEFHEREQKREKEFQKLEEAAKRLREQNSSLELMNTTLQTSMLEKAEQLAANRLKDKEEQIINLNGMLRKFQDDIATKMERLGESVYKNVGNSSLKGKSGETQVEEILKLSLDSEVESVSNEAYAADFHLFRHKRKYKYLVDSKNYTRMVSQAEVDKLHRDLRLQADAVGAILISLNQGIVGHSRAGDIDVEFNELGKPIVYIGNLNRREEIMVTITSLRPFFEVVERLTDLKEQGGKTEIEAHEKLQHRSHLVTSLLRNHIETVVKAKNTFMNNKKKIEVMYNEQYALLIQMEGHMRNTLAVALGDEDQTRQASLDDRMPLPSSVFRKTNRTDLTEKEAKFVEWMERTFTFAEEREIDLKVFLEKAAAEGFADKEARGMREKLFTDEAWPKQGRKLRGLSA